MTQTRIILFCSTLLSGIFLAGCGDIQQDLFLNANGSGTLETTFDMGEMMSMIGSLQDAVPTDEPEPEAEPADKKKEKPKASDSKKDKEKAPEAAPEPADNDPMQNLIEKVTDPSYARAFDTLIPIASIMPDSVREKDTRPDLVERIRLRIQSPANSASMAFGIQMQFDSPAQLREIVNHLEQLDNSSSGMMPTGGSQMPSESFLVFDADMKAGWIRFEDVDYSEAGGEFGMSGDSTMTAEDLGMMEMMFGSTKIKTIIHVPGEVLSCTEPTAVLTKDNKVIIEHGMMDVLREKVLKGYQVNFKPKK